MPFKLTKSGSKQTENSAGNDKALGWQAILPALIIFLIGMISGFFVYRGGGARPFSGKASKLSQGSNDVRTENSSKAYSIPHMPHKRFRGKRRFRPYQKKTNQPASIGHTKRDEMSEIMALGYLSGYKVAPKEVGVLVHDERSAFQGLNFMVSGHAPEALLLSMDGQMLHKWHMGAPTVWPDLLYDKMHDYDYWRRAYLFENGDVLAIFERIGLIKIDKDSNLLWSYDGKCHHDLYVAADGRIFVLEAETRNIQGAPLITDFITVLNPQGELQKRVSLYEAFEKSRYAPLLDSLRVVYQDLFHTNTLEVFDGSVQPRPTAFREGNILISTLNNDVIAVLDMKKEEIVWAVAGMWSRQHQPTRLDNGNLLVFNNGDKTSGSEVVEFDPLTQDVVWSYKGGDEQNPFYSATCGSAQRLQNGNTLITESDNGRAFEVTPENTIVWEYVNPRRAGKNDELIATLFEMIRLPPQFPVSWALRQESESASAQRQPETE